MPSDTTLYVTAATVSRSLGATLISLSRYLSKTRTLSLTASILYVQITINNPK
ncbi:MAG: hypothetical protein MUC60_18515 [Oscillatoria sp. Prado101]|nr:hypothetical protein [Oscillatoria sp. Prado101]